MAGMTRFDIEPAYACLSCMRQVPSFEVWQRHTERGLVFTHHAADGHPVVRIVFREQQAQAPPASDPPGLVASLREQVRQWRDRASGIDDDNSYHFNSERHARANQMDECADEIEELLPASPQAKED